MRTVVSTVCNNWYSGTDQEVRLNFKSIKKTPGKEDKVHRCWTETLDTGVTGSYENDWATGGTQTWGYTEASTYTMYGQPVAGEDKRKHNFLGKCAKNFRVHNLCTLNLCHKQDQLMFKIEIVRPQPPPIDDINICKLVVTFGVKGSKGYSQWVWGDSNDSDGLWTEDGESKWVPMTRIDSSEPSMG